MASKPISEGLKAWLDEVILPALLVVIDQETRPVFERTVQR
jgi:hypothetical protein